MGRFKVGDLVRVREWDDMVRQFGTCSDGDIRCSPRFTSGMKRFCGEVYEILSFTGTSYVLKGSGIYFFSENALYPAITYREYAEKVEPKRIMSFNYGGVEGCPFSLPGMCQGKPCFCESPNHSDEVCGRCWDRYLTEKEYKEYEIVKKEKENMRFKKGDYVKVAKATDGNGANWVREMDGTIGKTYKIKHVDGDETCKLEGIDLFWFPFEALELARPKDMLTPFCTVKLRNENVYVFDGKNRLLRGVGYMDVDRYDENLNYPSSSEYDIVNICEPGINCLNISELLSNRGECIWNREEVVEITAEEAVKKLSEQYPGQTVKIVV